MKQLFSSVGRSLSLTAYPFTVFRLAVSPDEAVARCVALLHKNGIRTETPGMREQFARIGWVGTELATGNTGKAFLVDAIASTTTTGIIAELFPRAVPDRVKRAFLEKTRIEVIARPIPGGMRPMCKLWCHFDYTSTNETMFAEDYIASMLEGGRAVLPERGTHDDRPRAPQIPRYAAQRSPNSAYSRSDAQGREKDDALESQPLTNGPAGQRHSTTARRPRTQTLAAGAGQRPRRESRQGKAQPCARREATSYRAIPVATAALRDSTVDAIGIDTI